VGAGRLHRRAGARHRGRLAVDVVAVHRLSGFRAFPYAEYSEVFFGDEYRVLPGGAKLTDTLVTRLSFRNWDYSQRRQIFSASGAPVTRSATEPRIRIDVLADEADRRTELYDATFWSLRGTPKELPAVWLYDERGSRMFEEITRLPEYYPTAAEREILMDYSPEVADVTGARTLVELGAGTSEKTLLLLDALDAARTLERFVPLDSSATSSVTSRRFPTAPTG
jgi:Histidine-specific methyltransferase, SAM-dependent